MASSWLPAKHRCRLTTSLEVARAFWSTPDDRSPALRGQEAALDKSKAAKLKAKAKPEGPAPKSPPVELPSIEEEKNPVMRRIIRRLQRQFGLSGFRPGQETAIRALVEGRDVLGIMPTGAGKSFIYQLTAFELPGVTVVVSPLLALMRDQEQKLRRTGVVAARFDSTLTTKETNKTLDDIEEGKRKLIYVTPERAASGNLLEELGGQSQSLCRRRSALRVRMGRLPTVVLVPGQGVRAASGGPRFVR